VIYTPLAGDPATAHILPLQLADKQPARIDHGGSRNPCEAPVHPEDTLPELTPTQRSDDRTEPPSHDQDPKEL
jgi:hypothetical protein